MKNIIIAAIVSLFALSFAHADVTLSGRQSKGSAGSGAKLESTAVTISKTMTISAVSGSNIGFWIQKGSVIVARYYKSNDSSAVGKQLPAGTYTVYPNIPNKSNSATVTLTLK